LWQNKILETDVEERRKEEREVEGL